MANTEFQDIIDSLLSEKLLTDEQKLKVLQDQEAKLEVILMTGQCIDVTAALDYIRRLHDAKKTLNIED